MTQTPATVPPSVRLEPFTGADFARLISWVPDEVALIQWAGSIFDWPLTTSQLEQYLVPTRPTPAVARADSASATIRTGEPYPPTRLVWKALDVASGEAVGHVELNSIDPRHASTTLSRVMIGPPYRGRGYSPLMVAAVLPIAFDELGMHRVDLVAFEYNEPALRCYRSLGFTREGVMRDARFFGGAYVNSVVMSMLEDEWQALAGR